MPLGRYPSRVKDFTKWSRGLVEKAEITNSATTARTGRARRKRRRKRRKRARKGKKEE